MRLLTQFLAILLLFGALANANELDYADLVARIKQTFKESIALYESGKQDEARLVAQSAYFELFENLEGPIRINVSARKSYAMESKFVKIRKLIAKGAPIEEVRATIDDLSSEMDEVLPKIEKGARLVAENSEAEVASKEASNGASEQPLVSEESSQEQVLEPQWLELFSRIEDKYAGALQAFKAGDLEESKRLIIAAQFEDYRNGMMETAIRRYVSQIRDGQIQGEMGRIVRAINAKEIEGEAELEDTLMRLKNSIYLALSDLPKEAGALAQGVEIPKTEVSSKKDFSLVVIELEKRMDSAIQKYEAGERARAMSLVQDSYFDIFEESGMELKIGAVDNTLKTAIEATFSQIVALMKTEGNLEAIKGAIATLNSQLKEGVKRLEGTDATMLFIYSLTIILREGIEALIVITAIIAYFIRSGNAHRLNVVYSALWTAIALSFVSAFVMNYLLKVSGEGREMLEGIVMLVAVFLLFYVGFWLLSSAHSKEWNKMIAQKVDISLSSGATYSLWSTVFLAVYREGAECVLFYQALFIDAGEASGYGAVVLGFALGVVLLVGIFYLLKTGAVRIPIRPFFIATSVLIFFMALIFSSKGVMELVEARVFEPTLIEGMPSVIWLGVYPYLEPLILQVAILFGAITSGAYIVLKSKHNES
ncbi:MAG: FTR1 family iron permease [Wolinella sp.]